MHAAFPSWSLFDRVYLQDAAMSKIATISMVVYGLSIGCSAGQEISFGVLVYKISFIL